MRPLFLLFLFFTTVMAPVVVEAQPRGADDRWSGPYGRFCPGSPRGGPYGARDPVDTASQAKRVIETCCSTLGQALHAGKVEETKWYFEVEILDGSGAMLDAVIIDKRTGRIRSIY